MHDFSQFPARGTTVTNARAEYFVNIPARLQSVLNRISRNPQVISPFIKAHRLTMSGISAIGVLSHCPSHLVYASLLIAHRATWHKIVRLVIGLTVIEVVYVKGVPANGFRAPVTTERSSPMFVVIDFTVLVNTRTPTCQRMIGRIHQQISASVLQLAILSCAELLCRSMTPDAHVVLFTVVAVTGSYR